MPSADSRRGRLDGVAPGHTRTGGGPTLTAERSGSAGACSLTREALVPVLVELTVVQADAIRATADGTTYTIGQANNALLYPGLGLGTIVSGAEHVTDGMLLAAANAVASQVDVSEPGASLLPPVQNLRASSSPSPSPWPNGR